MKIGKSTIEIIVKNGKPFVRMTTGRWVDEMMIYKANTDCPYVRRMSRRVFLDEDMKKMLLEVRKAG